MWKNLSSKLNKEEIEKLIKTAREARENAFVYKSGHSIGAAILSTDGFYFGGCNTESAISSLGVCAEMSAVDHAIVHGKYEFKAIAVVDETLTYPCGACLQYLSLFSQINTTEIEVVVANMKGEYKIEKLSKLLPHRYLTKNHIDKIKQFKNKNYVS